MRRVMAAHVLWVHLPGRRNIGPDGSKFNLTQVLSHVRLPAAAFRPAMESWPTSRPPGSRMEDQALALERVRQRQETPFMLTNPKKTEMLDELRVMLRDVLTLRGEGVPFARLARAHGYIDGYMRAMLEAKIVAQRELLVLVSEERARALGPATRELEADATAVA